MDKYNLIRQNEGHYLDIDTGDEYFSIWAFKHQYSIEKNITEQNLIESRILNEFRTMKMPQLSENFDEGFVYPKEELVNYYLRTNDIRSCKLNSGDKIYFTRLIDNDKIEFYLNHDYNKLFTVTLESIRKCKFRGSFEKTFLIENPKLLHVCPKEMMWPEAVESNHHPMFNEWRESTKYGLIDIFKENDYPPDELTVNRTELITSYPVNLYQIEFAFEEPFNLGMYVVDKINGEWKIVKQY